MNRRNPMSKQAGPGIYLASEWVAERSVQVVPIPTSWLNWDDSKQRILVKPRTRDSPGSRARAQVYEIYFLHELEAITGSISDHVMSCGPQKLCMKEWPRALISFDWRYQTWLRILKIVCNGKHNSIAKLVKVALVSFSPHAHRQKQPN